MDYELSQLEDAQLGSPTCFVPITDSTLTFFYGDTPPYSAKVNGVLIGGKVFPSTSIEIGSFVVPSCNSIEYLSHDEWVTVIFPFISIILILISLSIIYHAIIKRLLP